LGATARRALLGGTDGRLPPRGQGQTMDVRCVLDHVVTLATAVVELDSEARVC
jgi:hypothetical protein